MAGPQGQSDRDKWIAAGHPVYADNGPYHVETAYVTNPDGSEQRVYFYPDGTAEYAVDEVKDPTGSRNQYSAVRDAYRAANYAGTDVNQAVKTGAAGPSTIASAGAGAAPSSSAGPVVPSGRIASATARAAPIGPVTFPAERPYVPANAIAATSKPSVYNMPGHISIGLNKFSK